MAREIEFYFDFSSPYGYLASTQIEAVAAKHDYTVHWRPYLLGAVFKVTGAAPLNAIPLKGEYLNRDVAREARRLNVPLTMPAQFPFGTVTSCRAFYHLEKKNPEQAKTLAKAIFSAAFGRGEETCPVEAIVAIAEAAGFDGQDILTGVQTQEARAHLKAVVDEAIGRGVFGSPFFFVDGEPFWGNDRLDQIDRWMAQGGW